MSPPNTPFNKSTLVPGKVWLVGAGPGDPDLLTLRALRVIQAADLILFDQLVSEEIRALFPKQVPQFYVGKQKGEHSIPQQNLNALLVKKARQGLQVVRVKGGDPFIFGRGSEELLVLRHAGIEAEVVPGITAASGASTYAGIPLTHRGLAQGCTLVTAQGETDTHINWSALVQLKHTLVFYMGLSRADWISGELRSAGMSFDTPAALIENGCRNNQRVFITSVGHLAQTAQENNVQSPALIVVGEVVRLAHQLQTPVHNFVSTCQRLSA
ncbi:MAG: uroporphyrinogen-III C-methyltransferase [Moraxellaceae bacterium]|nr:MAG: uroporphyrinogen-III C-methyltransferase [Moraxellaceae bacterium]